MNDAASKAGTQEIVVDEVFPHAPETIWKTLTSGALMARWLTMTPTGFEPVKGRKFTYQTTPGGSWDGVIHCEVLEAIPNERLVYTWKSGHAENVGYGAPLDTVVTFTLSRVENGTRLRLVHSGFVLPENEPAFTNMSGGWKTVVPTIGAIAGGTGRIEKTLTCVEHLSALERRARHEHATDRVVARVGNCARKTSRQGKGNDSRP